MWHKPNTHNTTVHCGATISDNDPEIHNKDLIYHIRTCPKCASLRSKPEEPMKTEPNYECEKALMEFRATNKATQEFSLLGSFVNDGFRAGWAARGNGDHRQLNSDAFNLAIAKKDNARMASEIDRLQSMLKKQEPATSTTDTFSDRLNALTETLRELTKHTVQLSDKTSFICDNQRTALDAILAAIARECGGAK